MVEPAENPGTVFFAIVIASMVVGAGVAYLPPARDLRVFIGAVTLFCAWVIVIAVQKYFGAWDISSSFFLFDVAYAAVFYFLSIPSKTEPQASPDNVRWAGFVFAIFVLMIAMQLVHVFYTKDFPAENAAIIFCSLIFFLIMWGVVRGFGWMAAILCALVFLATNVISIFFYLLSSNLLTLAAIGIVLFRSTHGIMINVRAWKKALSARVQSKRK